MNDLLVEKFKLKSGKLNNNYKLILNKLDESTKTYINSLFPEYDDVGDKLKSLIEGDYRKCPVCNTTMSWKDNNKTCSKECSRVSLVQNQEKTNLERYGVRNVAMAEQFENKKQSTNLERYGVTHPLKNKVSLDKMKETNLNRYGVEWVSQNSTVHQKQRNTCISRYGVDYAAQSKSVRCKNVITNLNRYGVEYPYQSPMVFKKLRSSINQYKINYIKSKTGYTLTEDQLGCVYLDHRREYSSEFLSELVDYITTNKQPAFDIIKQEYKDTRYYTVAKKYGYDFDYRGSSSYENEIVGWLTNEFNVDVIRNTKSVITPYELDIYIPDRKLAIEFNGSYWHSEKYKSKLYHQEKTKACNELGITLIHIHEHLYIRKKEVFKSIIKSKLGLNDRIFARCCQLTQIGVKEEREFLNKYHLHGYTPSSICYGLYYKDILVSVCSFGKCRFKSDYTYELIRNCTIPNVTVVGGLSKAICEFKREFNQRDLICYSDASISYNKGSTLTAPNYIWWRNNLTLSRYQTMKHKLPKLLGDGFDPNLSESNNMLSNGSYRDWETYQVALIELTLKFTYRF